MMFMEVWGQLILQNLGILPAAGYALKLSGTDTGADLSAFFTIDIRGISRPQGGAWDKGATEQ